MFAMVMRFLGFALLLVVGCSQPNPAPATRESSAAPNAVLIDPIATLGANRLTHLASSSAGLFFVQEEDGGGDHVRRLSDLDAPLDTGLSGLAIGRAIGHPLVVGNIQALAADANRLYFFFAGADHGATVACAGWFDISTGNIQILADAAKLAQLIGSRQTLSICRPEMAASGNVVWLWLHSLAGSSFLHIDPTDANLATAISRPFDELTVDLVQPDFTHEDYAAGGGADGSLLIEDRWLGAMWQIAPRGHTLQIASLTSLPHGLSAPAEGADGKIAIFAAAGPAVVPREDSPHPPTIGAVNYPALLLYHDQQFDSFGQATLHGQADFPVAKLALSALVLSPDQSGWIAYDPPTGELFRLRLGTR